MESSDQQLRKVESDVLQSTMTITMLRQAVANMNGRLQSMNQLIEIHGVGECCRARFDAQFAHPLVCVSWFL
jgi:hypothetical protein